jgi:hypothetical protein
MARWKSIEEREYSKREPAIDSWNASAQKDIVMTRSRLAVLAMKTRSLTS